jgi:ammonia channel protein AmtB
MNKFKRLDTKNDDRKTEFPKTVYLSLTDNLEKTQENKNNLETYDSIGKSWPDIVYIFFKNKLFLISGAIFIGALMSGHLTTKKDFIICFIVIIILYVIFLAEEFVCKKIE